MKNCGKTFQLQEKTGFTLAEVLITLGIIGVVAAMTIPTLLANMTGNRHRSQFKKTISTLSQAARMSLEQYGFDFGGTTYWHINIEAECAEQHPEDVMTICSLLNGTLAGGTALGINTTYYNDAKTKRKVYPKSELQDAYIYQLADGSFFGFSPGITGCTLPIGATVEDINCSMAFIDVNGLSLPNKEVTCSQDGVETTSDVTIPCVVDTKDITDIFPVYVHDSIVEPASNAAKYVLNTAK